MNSIGNLISTSRKNKNLTQEEANAIQSTSIEHATLDLRNEIEKGNFPKWDLHIQMLKKEDFDKLDFNPVDVTKVWPETVAKSVKVGTMTLNANPTNYFQQVEQAAFAPSNLVPGIEPSEDKLLQGRLFSYADTQRHRLTGNHQQIPVNASKNAVKTYNQDGYMSLREQKGDVNYQPSTNLPAVKEDTKFKYSKSVFPAGTTTAQAKIDKENNFKQAGDLYKSFSKQDKDNLIKNLGGALGAVKNKTIVAKMISHFYQADREFGMRLAEAVKMDRKELESLLTK